ncbi:DUF2892 domain-containing protein [Candidatus Woesearchaeota archaeon]|nr:DUF2892 domain-containing protein [Candidatus Woesearchaeota archaeon]
MIKQNLGKLDRLLRFLLAFWWLGPWQPMVGGPLRTLMLIVAWVALVESFLGWCWLHDLLGIKNTNQ